MTLTGDLQRYRQALLGVKLHNNSYQARRTSYYHHARRRAAQRYQLELTEALWQEFYQLCQSSRPLRHSLRRDFSQYLVQRQHRWYRLVVRNSASCVVTFLPYNQPPAVRVWQEISCDDTYAVDNFKYGVLAVNWQSRQVDRAFGTNVEPTRLDLPELAEEFDVDLKLYDLKIFVGQLWDYQLRLFQTLSC
jgi:hypothetical protein